MSAALDPHHIVTCLEGIAAAVEALHDRYGVRVVWVRGTGDAGGYDGPSRTVTVNLDHPLDDQVWLLAQAWTLCTAGPHAVPAAVRLRHLRSV